MRYYNIKLTNSITTRKGEKICAKRTSVTDSMNTKLWLCLWQHNGHKDAFTMVPFMLTTSVCDTGTKAKPIYLYMLYCALLRTLRKTINVCR